MIFLMGVVILLLILIYFCLIGITLRLDNLLDQGAVAAIRRQSMTGA